MDTSRRAFLASAATAVGLLSAGEPCVVRAATKREVDSFGHPEATVLPGDGELVTLHGPDGFKLKFDPIKITSWDASTSNDLCTVFPRDNRVFFDTGTGAEITLRFRGDTEYMRSENTVVIR